MTSRQEYYSELAVDLELYTEQKHLEEHFEMEAERWHDTCELIAAIGNHEAKGIALLELWQQGSYLSSSRLDKELAGLQTTAKGEKLGWMPAPGVIFKYCQASLEPIGQVVLGRVPGTHHGMTDAYKISGQGIDIGVPAVGLIGDWSLKYPDLSTQTLLGTTGSNGDDRAPEHTLNVLLEVLSNPEPVGVGEGEVAGLSSNPGYASTRMVNRLQRQKVLIKERVIVDNDKQFRVLSTEYSGKVPIQSLRPDTQLFYEFLGGREPGELFTMQDVSDYIVGENNDRALGLDLLQTRYYILRFLSNPKSAPQVERLGDYNGGHYTKISIAEDNAEATAALLNIVLGIHDQDPALMAYGRTRAQEIINDPYLVAQLMRKARRFSSHAGRTAEQTMADVLATVIASEGPLKVSEIQTRYEERTSKVLGEQALRNHLETLVDTGKVEIEEIQNDETRKRRNRHYFAATTPEISE